MINPILEKELKSRMRTWKAPITIIIYLAFIGIVTYMSFLITGANNYDGFEPTSTAKTFDAIMMFQLGIICFAVPMLTATAISGERERQTLDLMLCTNISPYSIIFGKIYSSLANILLLVVMSMPFLSIVFVLGGVGVFDLIKIILYYLATAFTLSTIAIYASSKYRKNITAIVMSYIIMAAIYVIPLIIMIIITASNFYMRNEVFMHFVDDNPYLIISALFGSNPFFGALSFASSEISGFYREIARSVAAPWLVNVDPWIITMVFYCIISVTMIQKAKKQILKRAS